MKAPWRLGWALIVVLSAAGPFSGVAPADAAPDTEEQGLKRRGETPPDSVTVPRGTRVPLVLINSISTKHAAPGDKVYLESVYPVVVDGRVAVPPGAYVSGIVVSAKRPGRVKGRGELFLRFEQMILPNGTVRDLVGRVGAIDGRASEDFDREEGKITSEGSKGGDARTVGEATVTGTSIGVIAGASSGQAGFGAGVGAAAGAAAGLIGVLLSRGPDAVLAQGMQIDMTLDRDLYFSEQELTFEDALRRPGRRDPGDKAPRQGRGRKNRRFDPLPL